MVKIRLKRMGKKKKPFYHVVVSNSRFPRDGRFIEKLGTYCPMTKTLNVNYEKLDTWIKNGAQMTDVVSSLTAKQKVQS